MNSMPFVLALALAAGVLSSGPARAELLDRGMFNGVVLIYDSTLDITWVGDANLAATSGFDADGLMDWPTANAWATGLTIGGFTNWRLPTTAQPDPTCELQAEYLGFPVSYGHSCTGSEMGHLANVDGIHRDSPGPFTNVAPQPPLAHWSATEFASEPYKAWVVSFGTQGGQGAYDKTTTVAHAWAVHDGDVARTVHCEMETDQTIYGVGDRVTVTTYRLTNSGTSAVAVELKAWITTPLRTYGITNLGADGSSELPPGLDIEIGPFDILTIAPGYPTGTYTLGCRLLDPVTGAVISVDVNDFEVQ